MLLSKFQKLLPNVRHWYILLSSCCSADKLYLTLCYPMNCMPVFSVNHYFLEFAQTYVLWVSDANHLILYSPLLLLPSIFPASKSSNEWALRISWPMYWRFSFSISPFDRSCIILNSKFTFTILFKLMLSRVKQITNPGGMHETSAWAWCTEKT